MSAHGTGAAALALLLAGSTTCAAQVRRPAQPVTVAVQVSEEDAGPYRLTTAQGIRAVSPLAGTTRAGELPLTFFIPTTLAAGRHQIATLALPRRAIPVLFTVREVRDVALSAARIAPVRPGANAVTVMAVNRGNVETLVHVRASSPGLRVKVDRDTVRLPAGGSAAIGVKASVPSDARPGATYDLSVALTYDRGVAAAATQVHLEVGRAVAVLPIEVGALGDASGTGRPLFWLSAQGWISDSVRIQAAYGTRSAGWYGSLPARGRSVTITAPRWRFAAGEITLARPTEVAPWLSGPGIRGELGRARGWSLAGGWLQDPVTGATAAQGATSLRMPRVRLDAGLLHLASDGGRHLLPTLGLSARGTRLEGGASGGVLLSDSSTIPVGSASARLSLRGLRAGAAVTRTAQPSAAGDATTVSTAGSASVDLRTGQRASWFVTGGANRSERDSVGGAAPVLSAAAARVGARFRRGAVTVVPAAEIRTLARAGVPRLALRGGALGASSRMGSHGMLRGEAGLAWISAAAASTEVRPRLSGGIEWTAGPGYLNLSAAYGDALGALTLREPSLHGQLGAGLWAGPGSLDLDLVLDRARTGGAHLFGVTTGSLHVGRASDVLVVVRRTAGLGTASAWSVAVGARTSGLRIPLPRAERSMTLFDDRNADGRRDGDEPGLPGVPISGTSWTGTTDARGRFQPPAGSSPAPDLSVLGHGWSVGATSSRAIAAVRLGSLVVRVAFGAADPFAVERTPRGSVVLVTPRGESMPAPLDSAGAAVWRGLATGTYRAYHLRPGDTVAATPPAGAASIVIEAGTEAEVVLRSSYGPRRIIVRALDRDARPTPIARPALPSAETPPAVHASPAPASPPCAVPAPGAVRPRMSEPEVRCVLGTPARISRRGRWTYWFYPRDTTPAGGRYDDVVFFHEGRVVTALLQPPRRRYLGPPPHESIVGELRLDGR